MPKTKIIIIISVLTACAFYAVFFFLPNLEKLKYNNAASAVTPAVAPVSDVASADGVPVSLEKINPEDAIVVTHIPTPVPVKALYITKWITGNSKSRTRIEGIADGTEINAVVIDIKDYTGRISFSVSDPLLVSIGSAENDIKNIKTVIKELHDKNIYVIGRVSTFQDAYLTKMHPEWSITNKTTGLVWKDNKGMSFLDPTDKNVWDYIVAIARNSYADGFDEINFDYIRYPSDGNIKEINYNLKTDANGIKKTRADNIEAFFKYLSENVKSGENIPISADLFGLTTIATDDMGIGQVLERALPYFDYVAPMVYPSHYGTDFNGLLHPATHPYEVVSGSMKGGVAKLEALKVNPATPIEVQTKLSKNQLRPWLQDFNLGAVYTKEMVQAEIKAVYDSGLDSWMMWDAANKYTPEAFAKDETVTETVVQ